MFRTLLKPLAFFPALVLIYLIFTFSSQEGNISSQISYKVSYKIIQVGNSIFDADLNEWQLHEWANRIHFITRKLAHVAQYFALAVAVSFPLYVYGLHGFPLMLVAGFLCVGVASADEYFQSFVDGRSGAVRDVIIDSVGIFFGIIFVRIIGWTGRKTIFRPRKPKRKKKHYDKKYRQAPPKYQKQYQQIPQDRYQDRYQQMPQDRYQDQYRQMPQDRYQDQYRQVPQDNYQRQPPNSFIQEPEYLDTWDIDISDTHMEPPRPTNEHLADDWGQNDNQARPKTGTKNKKKKDWFFDM